MILNGHWLYETTVEPDNFYGFIYCITYLPDNVKYIGKKSFHTWNKTGSKKTGKARWKDYTSSSKELNEMIKEHGKELFKFEILLLCCTKSCWSYAENNIMHKLDVLTSKDTVRGKRVYLNRRINATQWVPKHCTAVIKINQLSNEKPTEQEEACPGRLR